MSSCQDYAWGIPPKDAQIKNLLVTNSAVVCDLTAVKGGGGDVTGTVVTLAPVGGDGATNKPVSLEDGGATTIPQYPLWMDGSEWVVDEIQCLQREDNVITVCNIDSPVDLSVLGPLIAPGADKVVLCLSGDSTLGSQAILSCTNTTQTTTLKAPDGNLLDGTSTTKRGSTLVIQSGAAGTTGDNEAGKVVVLGGINNNIYLGPGGAGQSGTVYIGSSDYKCPSHLGSSDHPTIIGLVPGSPSYYLANSGIYATDMAGTLSVSYFAPPFGSNPQVPNTDLVSVQFLEVYNAIPRAIILSPLNGDAWNAQFIVSSVSTTAFILQHSAVKVYVGGSGGGANAYTAQKGYRWINVGTSTTNNGIYPITSPPSAFPDTIDLTGLVGGSWTAQLAYLVIE